MSDSFLSDAGFLFFAVWTVFVACLGIAVFARDVVPAKRRLASPQESSAADVGTVAVPKL